jgi:hypothetical protein
MFRGVTYNSVEPIKPAAANAAHAVLDCFASLAMTARVPSAIANCSIVERPPVLRVAGGIACHGRGVAPPVK